jgi:hypothetical protein
MPTKVSVPEGATDEKVGFIEKDGTFRKPDAVTNSTDRTAEIVRTAPQPGDVAVIHSHIPGDGESLADIPKGDHKAGDAQSLRQGMPNGTVLRDRIGVHEIVDGRLQFRMIEGKMTYDERRQIQKNLNIEQKEFERP